METLVECESSQPRSLAQEGEEMGVESEGGLKMTESWEDGIWGSGQDGAVLGRDGNGEGHELAHVRESCGQGTVVRREDRDTGANHYLEVTNMACKMGLVGEGDGDEERTSGHGDVLEEDTLCNGAEQRARGCDDLEIAVGQVETDVFDELKRKGHFGLGIWEDSTHFIVCAGQ